MLTGRGYAVLGGGLLLWLGSRMAGSADLHMVALGMLALIPLSLALVRWARPELHATRRLSTPRAFPGTRVRVDIEVQNRGRRRTSILLLEDRLPDTLGASARAVLGSLPPRGRQTASYHVTARSRGRYRIGPLSIAASDPFDIARRHVELPGRLELVVYPAVEDLDSVAAAAPTGSSGESSIRQLLHSGEEFYTMRHYEVGDDLRRIHWPSVARTGDLMIRQDEAARRAAAVLLLDSREAAFGGDEGSFERAVSASASIGVHYLRSGYGLRLSTPELPPRRVATSDLLERLALVGTSRVRVLTPALLRLRALAAGSAALVVVTHVPTPAETAALSRLTAEYRPKLAVLVYRQDPEELYLHQRRDLERDVDTARRSLIRAGWEVLLLRPDGRLGDLWRARRRPVRVVAASW